MNNLWKFVSKTRLSAAEYAKKFDFPQGIEGLLREKVFGGQDVLELVGIGVANHARCRNQHEMYGLTSGSFGGKHRLPVHHFLHILIGNGISGFRKFHLAKVDDLIVAVDQQVDLHAFLLLALAPFSSSLLRVETHEQALLTMPLMPKAAFICGRCNKQSRSKASPHQL